MVQITAIRTLSASDPKRIVGTGRMRLEIKLQGSDLYAVATTRRLNDPAVSVATVTSQTSRHIPERDDVLADCALHHSKLVKQAAAFQSVTTHWLIAHCITAN